VAAASPPATEPGVTFRQHLAAARARLRAAGIPAPEAAFDAELLARHVLGWDRAAFLARAVDSAPAGFAAAYEPLVARRARREPVAYIRGRQEFLGRDFAVSAAVLIPRPETELIVEEALGQFTVQRSRFTGAGCRIADIGTGSGCLAVSLALEIPGAEVTATDISEAALELARTNADRQGVRIVFRRGSLLAGAAGPFDLIVSNPPYVAERDRPSLAPEVRDREPASALFAGADGLDVIRQLVPAAAAALAPGATLLIEIGAGQHEPVAAIVAATPGLSLTRLRHDLQDIPRVAVILSA
jgi:release factor glutamine methyltransferase